MNERYELTIERIRSIADEETVAEVYRDYFQSVARFILDIYEIRERLCNKAECTLEELKQENERIYSDVTGIRTDEYNPGYKHIFIEPRVGGNLTWAKGSYESVY